MNDTIISNRQQQILLELVSQPCTRSELEVALQKSFPVSKITLLRDLQSLIDNDWIITAGIGRATKYLINDKKSLLVPFNLDDYFSENSNLRFSAKESFDQSVFSKLNNLFSDEEKKQLQKTAKSLSEQKKRLDPTIFNRELERFTIEFSWKSSRIEGNTYSLLETERLLKQKMEAPGHSRDEAIMIINHKDTLGYIMENLSFFTKLNLDGILKVHSLITDNLAITAGIRNQQVGISGTNYLPPRDKKILKVCLEKTINLINTTVFPLAKALITTSMISYLQPFTDGNKRTGRMIANAILLAYDSFPLSYRDVDEIEYKKSLIVFYEQNNICNFKRIFVEQFIYSNSHYLQV